MRKDPRDSRRWRALRRSVLARDSYVCQYCGEKADTVDHVLPVAKYPELAMSPDNCVSACRRCNSRKGSRSQASFLRTTFAPPDCANLVFAPETIGTDHELPRSRPD
jgi:5-methylcytosine-specific restriction endonuclease McrA